MLLKFGIVTQIDETKALVRVQFQDIDGVLSYWLPVMQLKTLKDKQYWMPDLNEHVVCLLDEHGEEGVVIGAIYSQADAVPVSSKDKYHVKFEDGTIIEYDRANHKLYADVKGDIEAKATGNATVDIGGNLAATVGGEVDISGGSQVTVTGATAITLQAPAINFQPISGGSTIGKLQGDFEMVGNLTITGNVEVDGSIHATGTIMDDSGNSNHHTHP